MAIDPACGVEVDPTDPDATATFQGTKYVFCSEGCKEHFEAAPDQYVEVTEGVVELNRIGDVRTQRIRTPEETKTFELSVAEPGRLRPSDEGTYTREMTVSCPKNRSDATGILPAG